MRNTLLEQPGVEKVAIDFDKKIAYLISAETQAFDSEAAIAALGDAGYGATLQATP